MKSSLNDIQWKTFVIGELFEAKRPTARKEDDYCDGDIPFIASGGINNGVTKFCSPKNGESLDTENCLSVSPVDGSCYYQSYPFLGRGGAGSSIILLYPKNFTLDAYTALFLSKAITQTTATKYSYGHMASLDRIKKDKIYLPIDTNGEIDFQFMSSFMRQIEQRILKPTIDKLCKQLIIHDLMGGVNRFTLIGKHSILQRYSLKFNVVSDLKRRTTKLEILRMYHQHHSTMGLMDSSAMIAA